MPSRFEVGVIYQTRLLTKSGKRRKPDEPLVPRMGLAVDHDTIILRGPNGLTNVKSDPQERVPAREVAFGDLVVAWGVAEAEVDAHYYKTLKIPRSSGRGRAGEAVLRG